MIETSYELPTIDVCHKDAYQFGSVIFPGQSYSYKRIVFPNNPPPEITESMKAVLNGTMVFYFQDCANYVTFGHVHKSSFLFLFGDGSLG